MPLIVTVVRMGKRHLTGAVMLVRIGNANDVADRQMRVFEVAGTNPRSFPADLRAET